MKDILSEYGMVVLGSIIAAALLSVLTIMFQDGGAVKEVIVKYIQTVC